MCWWRAALSYCKTVFDARLVDEVHVFIAPRTIGGETLPSPIGGSSAEEIAAALHIAEPEIATFEGDTYLRGRITRA